VTAEHWFDPEAAGGRTLSGAALRPARDAGSGRQAIITGAVVLVLISAVVTAIGTLSLLAAGGWLAAPAATDGSAAVVTSPSPAPVRSPVRPDTRRIAAQVSQAIVTVIVAHANDGPRASTASPIVGVVTASGVVFDHNGWVITNRHVVCGAETIAVVLSDGRRLAGRIYGLDSLTDLAIVRVDATGLPAADIGDSASLRPGALSLVIGTSADDHATTVASGIVSAMGRDLLVTDPCGGERRALRNVIQTDAHVTVGSSGGALVDTTGAVVGISTSIAGDTGLVAYAIPVNIAKPIMEQAIEEKPLTRPWMGITYTALDAAIANANGLAIDHGAWLRGSADGSLPAVVPGGPADLAGLQEGDVLTAIGDQRIDSAHTLDDILSQYRPESQDPIEVSVFRDGAPLELSLILGTRSEPSF
jgi:S1-C subfamily serine protease